MNRTNRNSTVAALLLVGAAGLAVCLSPGFVMADSAEIRVALKALPELVTVPTNGGDRARFFNYTPRPERLMTALRPLGNLPHRRSVDVPASPLGIGFETLDRDTFDPKKTFSFLAESGVKWARCQTGWMKCEKTVGQYDFAWLDEVVDGLGKIGIETWFSVGFGHPHYTPCKAFEEAWAKAKREGTIVPGWARGYVRETPWYHGEAARKGWRNYLKALARHFRGRVRVWEVWNEPEWFWWYEGSAQYARLGFERCAKDFCDFLKFTVAAIREEIPDAQFTVNLAALSHGCGWIHVFAQEKVADWIDIFNYHNYNNTPEANMRELFDQMRACLVRSDGKPLRIWQGESGRASGPSALFAMPSEYAQAKFVTRRILTDLREGAEMTSIFTVTDFLKYYVDGRDQFYGLIDARGNRAKLGFTALQHLGWLCDGLRRAPEDFVSFGPQHSRQFGSMLNHSAVAVASFRRKGVPVVAWWQREHLEITADPLLGEIVLSLPELGAALPDPVLVDPIRGKVWDAKEYRSYDVKTLGTLTFRNLYALDYPLILTDLSVFGDLCERK